MSVIYWSQKKKNGDYRILIDGRLLNNAMVRKATVLVAPLEIFAILALKTHVTIVDVSNAFFQIAIKFSDQPLTAFYSEAHGKRYCYTRAPQGFKKQSFVPKAVNGQNVRSFVKIRHPLC